MTQVDPPRSMLIFRSAAPDCGTAELGKDSPDYLLSRERDERAAAKNATSAVARSIHQKLAQAYAELRDRSGQ
jgi:hypothetical protein